jgi:hypothetical protein
LDVLNIYYSTNKQQIDEKTLIENLAMAQIDSEHDAVDGFAKKG